MTDRAVGDSMAAFQKQLDQKKINDVILGP